ncbi:translation initiation factor eIF-2B subunit delta isoform X2 [Ceratina calcarata]|uniref:Translation initiation factor eIF2B subunit delta n=1 Tax=Ceratina calcarata TaxID=156304 RepID=A0AAJ7JC76_9HYME|nr:translation initiation factor eIF-2B subunit delta isoform X2 [Ceratina calcarata]
MDPEEHLTDKSQPKFTRSAARHLRRKRLHDARKAEKQKENLTNGINARANQESITQNSNQPEVLTKSKARRLRVKVKAKLIDNGCLLENSCDLRESVEPANSTVFDIEQCKAKDERTSLKVESVKHSADELLNNKSPSANCNKDQSGTEPISDSCPVVTQIYVPDLTSVKREDITEVPTVLSTDKLSSETRLLDIKSETPAAVATKMTNSKTNVPEKSRDEVKAEREAKKAAKALAKAKAKSAKTQDTSSKKSSTSDKPPPSDSVKSRDCDEAPETLTKKPKETVQTSNKPVVNKITNACTKSDPEKPEADGEKKSKAELRAERRAKQEAQRAAKQQGSVDKSKLEGKEELSTTKPLTQTPPAQKVNKISTPKKIVQKDGKDNAHEINLFKHLYHEREKATVDVLLVNSNIHPAIIRLGTQYASKVIAGSNARCVAFLASVKQLIQDFERPSQADFIRGLEASLKKSVDYLHHCRPLAVSMQNALRHLKWQMTQLPPALSDSDAKSKLCNAIDTYIREQILLADKSISITIETKISNGDVILTYGYSSLIHKILLDAHDADKKFRVIVVDGRPWLEGKEQLRRLAKNGLECSYILINALSYVMPEVSKVFLGAHAILANGAVMSRVGTAQVALMARAFNIPVLVACETHKSCERVQTDSIVYNELGNADELARDSGSGTKKSLLANWKTRKSLNLLNITYDVTPADLVTAVVTELAILPCTSVPVILRIKPSEI